MQAAGQDVTRIPRRVGGLLRQRNFRLLWIGETVSAVGNAMAVVGVPLLAVTVLKASTFAVSAACLLSIRAEPSRKPARAMTTARAEILEGSRFIACDPYLRPMTIYSTISNLAFGGVTALVVVFLVRVIGLGSAAVGLLMALGGIGGVAGAVVVGRLAIRLGTARVLLLSALGAGLSGLLIPLTRPGAGVTFYVIGWAADAAGVAMGSIIAASFRQAYCPPSMLGRATASMRFLGFGSVPFGALAAGGLGTAFGIRNALWIILAIDALSGTILLTPAIRSRRNLPSEPEVNKPALSQITPFVPQEMPRRWLPRTW